MQTVIISYYERSISNPKQYIQYYEAHKKNLWYKLFGPTAITYIPYTLTTTLEGCEHRLHSRYWNLKTHFDEKEEKEVTV